MRLELSRVLFITVAAASIALGCDDSGPDAGTAPVGGGGTSTSASAGGSGGDAPVGGSGARDGGSGGVGGGGGGGGDGGDGGVAGPALWSVRLGGAERELGQSIAVDATGAVVVTGTGMFFTGFPPSPSNSRDIPLGKLDPSGALVWTRQFVCKGGDDDDFARVALDGSEVILATRCSGTIDFGGGELGGAAELALARFDAAGNHVWSKKIGGVAMPLAVAASGSGHVLVVGAAFGDSDFGGGLLAAHGAGDAFVVALDAGGTHVWSKLLGGPADDGLVSMAIDAQGAILLAGMFVGTSEFGGGALVSAGGRDGLLVKLDASGNHVFSKRFGDAQDQQWMTVATLPSGDMVVAGELDGAMDFGGGVLSREGTGDLFVARLGGAGDHVWSKRFAGDGGNKGVAIATDLDGNVFVSGGFGGTLELGGPPLTATSGIYVGKLDGSGAHVWSWGMDTAGNFGDQMGASLAPHSSGLLMTGWFGGTIDFGDGAMTSAGDYDAYVTKLPP